jgi:D-arginine dehydrogenase
MIHESDFVIIGAGIAGVSAAYHLAHRGSVTILERESQPAYHSTGRSAAVFAESYGPRLMRIMTAASGPFLQSPPQGFSDVPLMRPRGGMFIAREDQATLLADILRELAELSTTISEINAAEAARRCPVLRPGYVRAAAYDPSVMDMDVNAIFQGYLRGAKTKGCQLVTSAEVTALERTRGKWQIRTAAGSFAAPMLINAAGAWADVIAKLANVRGIGLQPKRRTVIVFDGPQDQKVEAWPIAADCSEEFYFKPEAGRILASPCDETPVPPQDIQPDEIDIALTVDRVEQASTLKVARILNRWAGLRSFVPDKTPVVGFAPDAEGFFWLAGQGGYGIQTSYAMGLTAASLATDRGVPSEIEVYGIDERQLGPSRLWASGS